MKKLTAHKMAMPKAKKNTYKPIKTMKKSGMEPYDHYDHGRPHVHKKVVGPRMPQGATL